MSARHFVRAGVVFLPLTFTLIWGCKTKQDTATTKAEPRLRAPAAAVATTPATAPAVAHMDAADAATTPLSDTLAQKTAEYARTLEPAMTAAPIKRHASVAAPPEPSSVQWDQPKHTGAPDPTPHAITPAAAAANTGA